MSDPRQTGDPGTGDTGPVIDDPDQCYAAVRSRDPRFDGWFTIGVTSTGIYCRPSCPALTPKRANVRFFPTPAAAQHAGFRSCKRCRPDATPGSPEWDARADVVGRAMRLIADGVVDREGVVGLAHRLGYSARQLQRLLIAEVGAGPQALARAQRAQAARILIETTDLSLAEIAFAAGFGSIRQFNDTVREVFDRTPRALRSAGRRTTLPAAPGVVTLRLAHRRPLDAAALLGFLDSHAAGGVGEAHLSPQGAMAGFRRTLDLPHAPGTATLVPGGAHIVATLRLGDVRDLTAAVARLRRLLDLDADPVAVDASLAEDPLFFPLIAERPGLRVPGTVAGFEEAVRSVVGQQISVAGASTVIGRLVTERGRPLATPDGGLTHLFPTADAVAAVDPTSLPMVRSRGRALVRLATAVASGDIDLDTGADRDRTRAELLVLEGIGPWTAECIALRALGDPDAFPATDLGIRRTLTRLAGPDAATPAALLARSERWRPWRAYATLHLWSALP
ncbi:AlkA N-terminal domain-containing protein [soil metagenome]